MKKLGVVVLFAGVSASVIAIFILLKVKTFNENDGPRISKDQHVQVDQQL